MKEEICRWEPSEWHGSPGGLLRVWTAQEGQGGGREAKATALLGAEDGGSSQGGTVG